MRRHWTYVTGATCPSCHTFVFSRSRHDFRWCPCGKLAVDGGFDYLKVSGTVDAAVSRKRVLASKEDLLRDYSIGTDKWGYVPGTTPKVTPYLAIGNGERESDAPMKDGDRVTCSKCGRMHTVVSHGKKPHDGMLLTVHCPKVKKHYLVGFMGKTITTKGEKTR